jgi:hypothetical protein
MLADRTDDGYLWHSLPSCSLCSSRLVCILFPFVLFLSHRLFPLSLKATGPPHTPLSAFGHRLGKGETVSRPNERSVNLTTPLVSNAKLTIECTRQTNDGP